ncbi:MAG: hypothetical protein AAFR60_06775, partial [Pseudomonadota bacterium]
MRPYLQILWPIAALMLIFAVGPSVFNAGLAARAMTISGGAERMRFAHVSSWTASRAGSEMTTVDARVLAHVSGQEQISPKPMFIQQAVADAPARLILAQSERGAEPASEPSPTLGDRASDFFDRFLGSRSGPNAQDGGASGGANQSGETRSTGVLDGALDYLDRARERYRDEVVPRLSGGG